MHGLNGLKYISTMVALSMRTIDQFYSDVAANKATNESNVSKTKGLIVWKVLAASSSGIATVVNTYWDIVIDWGLLRRNSRNPWLRDKLSVPYKSVYFLAMVSYYFVANITTYSSLLYWSI